MEPLPVVPVSTIAESTVTSEIVKEISSDIQLPDVMKNEQKDAKESGVMKRSLSEIGDSLGATKKTLLTSQSFPSLSDHVLRQLGLWLEEKQHAVKDAEQQSEKEVENSFMALLLAFQTDRLTLASRLELQTRLRDQAEQNMANEIQHLQNIVMKLSDRSEYFADIQMQIDNLHKAALRVSSAAEIYGAVQQENRLSKAVDVILRHVENLKEAYNKEQSEHVETKKILSEHKPINSALASIKPSCRRRATIAVGVAQNGTNLTPDITATANPLEAKLGSTTGQVRPRYSLTQRNSASKIETIQGAEKKIENPMEGKIERRSSLIPNLISTCIEDSNSCSHYSCYSDTHIDSDIGDESDGSVQDTAPVPPAWKRQSFTFSLEIPRISWSTDDVILHIRYGLAAVLLVAAIAVFCSSLYS